MIKLLDLLNEIVNDSLLYHNTSVENLLGIIRLAIKGLSRKDCHLKDLKRIF